MWLKLDENIDDYLADILNEMGHDCSTVRRQEKTGCSDEELWELVHAEERCLVSFDLDFSNVLNYRPDGGPGVVILRHPSPSRQAIESLISELGERLHHADPTGQLWIMVPGRVRIFGS